MNIQVRHASERKVLLSESYPLFRQAMRTLVKHAHPTLEIIEVGTFEDTVMALNEKTGIALIIIDTSMPDCSGLTGLFRVTHHRTSIPFIVTSDVDSDDVRDKVMAAGAAGYIAKSAP